MSRSRILHKFAYSINRMKLKGKTTIYCLYVNVFRDTSTQFSIWKIPLSWMTDLDLSNINAYRICICYILWISRSNTTRSISSIKQKCRILCHLFDMSWYSCYRVIHHAYVQRLYVHLLMAFISFCKMYEYITFLIFQYLIE